MPIQAPQWTDYLNCPICCREFGAPPRSPISLSCGHTFCKHCIKHLHRKQCPFDQTVIQVEPDELVVNTALLQLAGFTPPSQPYHPPSILALPEQDRRAYDVIVRCMEHLAVYLKYCGNGNNSVAGSRLSRPMQRKLVTLLQCPMTDEGGRGKAARAARSLGERTLTELLLQHQNPQQLSANLWAAVRARGCQFLGPAMQEEVLKLVLLALEDGSALSRKVLVMFVVQRLEPHFPQASKTSTGHVVQLLYRASCFKVSKRESNSSLMQLKEEFRTYDSLRREHDAQIVQIATEAGLRIAPDQWSALLYGDTAHKSHMQSIIDKLQSPQSFAQSVQELYIALQRTGDPAQLVVMSMHLDRLANIDSSPDAKCPSWQKLAEIMTSLKDVVTGLVHYLQQQNTIRDANHNQKYNLEPSTSQTIQVTNISGHGKFEKFDMARCGDSVKRTQCPRGANCPLIHADDDLEPYKVVLLDPGKLDHYQNVSNSSNVVPTVILQSDTTQNIQSQGNPQSIPPGIPQVLPPGYPQSIPSGIQQPMPQNVSQSMHQGCAIQRPTITSLPEMTGLANNVGYVYPRYQGLYPHYRAQGHLINDCTITAPSEMPRPYYSLQSPISQTMRYYTNEQSPFLQGLEAPEITNRQDINRLGQYPNKYQSSVFSGTSLLSPNDNIQQNNITQASFPSHVFPTGTPVFQFQDVPENADVMFETPNYMPMAIDLNPEAGGFAPWSPANRHNSPKTIYLFDKINNTLQEIASTSSSVDNNRNDDSKAVGSNRNSKCYARSENENVGEENAAVGSNRKSHSNLLPEDENLTEDNRIVGSNRNSRTNLRSEDEELEEELVALENYLTNEYKLCD